ncbi:MAG: acetylxylan esterase [Chloroflexi bacterium]|nr:acetylxylan esterase [Chloroflexota bacterium]
MTISVSQNPPLAQDMLAEHLYRVFVELSAANAERRAAIRSPEDWEPERRRLLEAYQRMLGRFPERTPLNPRVTGRLERDGYAIEKLIYETQPGLLVSALAYVPTGGSWPVPGVLVPCGHSENGKAAETYQRVCIGLAKKGYFILCYDPIGQGERKLYWNPEAGASDLGGNTTQHSYAGNQCTLLGINLAQYMVWDSIRGIDYLCSRPEVDPARIAIAGNSGGGTNTAYTAPLDPRIQVAVPCCYITTLAWRRRSWTTGDAEQDLLGQLPEGLDHADMLRLVAPRPVLAGSAAFDYFPLEGAKESVEIARDLYTTLGVPDRIAHAVANAPHGYSIELRRATYRWLNRWFGKEAEGDVEPEFDVERDEDCRCTPDGQVALLGSETIYSLNLRRLGQPVPPRAMPVRDAIVSLTKYEGPAARLAARPAATRLFRHEGLRRHERVELWPERDVAVPGSVFTWRQRSGPRRALLWIDGGGVQAALERPVLKAALAHLLPDNWLIMAIDVRGIGETAPRSTGRGTNPATGWIMDPEAFLTYESFVAGRPLFGMRLRDVACAVDYLLDRADVDRVARIALAGWGAGGLLALHAAALDDRISRVATLETLASYRSIVEHERYAHHVGSFIPGVVRCADSPDGYDLGDVEALIAPRPVLRLRSVDHLRQPLTPESDEQARDALLRWLAG